MIKLATTIKLLNSIGIIHHDIKLQNIMIKVGECKKINKDANNKPKLNVNDNDIIINLIDFGLSCFTQNIENNENK